MLWNRFEEDKPYLDLYATPDFDPSTGIIERDDCCRMVNAIDEGSNDLTKARAVEFILDHCAINVNPKCWFGCDFAGRKPKYVDGANAAIHQLTARFYNEFKNDPRRLAAQPLDKAGVTVPGQDYAHYVPDWDAVLALGFTGLRERTREYAAKIENPTKAQREFFESADITLAACVRFTERLARLAEKRINQDERMPLRVKCLKNLSKGAPTNIYEALQLIYLFQLIGQFIECSQVRSLGDIDRLLYPYYVNDLNRGTFTREQVRELLEYFFILFDFQEHRYNQPVSIGGDDIFGNTAVTELTHLIVDACFDAGTRNIKLHVFVNDRTPDDFLRKTMDMIRKGRGSFVYMNTDVGVKSMSEAYDMDVKSWMLGSQGCYNFNIKGKPQHCNQTRINLPKVVELTINSGVDPLTGVKVGADTPAAAQLDSFEKFEAAFYTQLESATANAIAHCDAMDETMDRLNPSPLMSCTFDYSLKEGKSCFSFGDTSILMLGIGTAADCLMMVKKHVYDKGEYSLDKLREMLAADWEGYEAQRQEMYADPEKYGNNLDAPDAFAVEISNWLIKRVTNRPNARGGKFVCHFETIDRCFRSGKFTGATPDGRKARSPFSKNLNAAFGQDRNGVTAMMLSACKLDVVHMPIGAPVDFMLHTSATQGEEGLTAMVELLRAFLRLGGYALQGNVLNAEMLKDAQKHPELYKNLQVRVSGWNWNFVDMAKEYQDAFILQAEGLN